MYGSRWATRRRRPPPPARAETNKGDSRPGHVPTPPRPRPGCERPASPKAGRTVFEESKSTDALEALGVALPAPDINVGAFADHRHDLVVDAADGARGRTNNKRIVGEALAFGDERAGADQRILSDLHAVEQDRAHA